MPDEPTPTTGRLWVAGICPTCGVRWDYPKEDGVYVSPCGHMGYERETLDHA